MNRHFFSQNILAAMAFICLNAFLFFEANAQASVDTLNMDITFVGNREMLLQDAHKLLVWPSMVSMGVDKPVFSYTLLPKRMLVEPEIERVEAKRVDVSNPLPMLYKGYARLGFGMYSSPIAELAYTDLRDRKSSWGFYGNHRSSNGGFNVNDSLPQRFSNSKFEAWGKRFWRRETLTFNGFVSQQGLSYLGLDSSVAVPLDAEESLRERFGRAGVSVHSETVRRDSGDWALKADLAYQNLWTTGNVGENTFLLSGSAGKFMDDLELQLHWDAIANARRLDSLNSTQQVVALFQPQVVKSIGALTTTLGANLAVDARGSKPFQVFPHAEAQLSLFDGLFMPYARLSGGVENNRLASVIEQNPYVNPESELKNTYRRFDFRGGLRGRVSSQLHYHGKFAVEHFQQYLYFVNDSTGMGGERFVPLYDTLTITTLGGDAQLNITEQFKLTGGVELMSYRTRNQLEAWNLPASVWKAGLAYSWFDKLAVRAQVSVYGARQAASMHVLPGAETISLGENVVAVQQELASFADINLQVEYFYNKRLSAWISGANLAGARYRVWNNYPVQGFQARFGATYAF